MRIVLTGASGQLGAYLLDALIAAGHRVAAWSGSTGGERVGVRLRPIDLTDAGSVREALDDDAPELVLHAAAMSAADQVRRDPERGWAVNVEATRTIADWCSARGGRLLFTSTDLVFDGSRPWYREPDEPRPILAYGRTKAAAEPLVLAVEGGLVARLSLLFGPSRIGRESFYDRALATLRAGRPQVFFEDEYRTPLDYATAAAALTRLAGMDLAGIVHVGGRERLSRFEMMRRVAHSLGIDAALVRANRSADVALPEPRPADVSLDTSYLDCLLPDLARPSLEAAVRRGEDT